jgi:hypothetical protein
MENDCAFANLEDKFKDNNNKLLHKVHGPLQTYQSRIPVYYNNNGLVYKVLGPLLTYQSRIPVYYNNNGLVYDDRLMYWYCNIQECVTGKSVTVHGPYGVMYCYWNLQVCIDW